MTTVIESGHPMPQCSYTLHRDSPNGPVLRYARVGDLVYHVWDCPSEVYAMLVHTCSILDGHGDEHIVVDSTGYLYNFLNSAVNQTSLNSGFSNKLFDLFSSHSYAFFFSCSTDDYIIPQLTYSNDLTRSFTVS